jgi:hypothetical protein
MKKKEKVAILTCIKNSQYCKQLHQTRLSPSIMKNNSKDFQPVLSHFHTNKQVRKRLVDQNINPKSTTIHLTK